MPTDPDCRGTGRCAGCNGTGVVLPLKTEHGYCKGTGRCQTCYGSGRIMGWRPRHRPESR